jgi:pyrophosphatase PpaX
MLLIFDLDGTVLDTYPLIRETFIQLFERFLPEYQYDETDLQSFFGPGLLDTFTKIGCSEEKAKHLFREYRKLNANLQPKYLRMFPDTREVLQALKDRGHKMAILSNKINEAITSNLKQMNLLSFFDLIIGIDQVKKPKPNREGIDLIKKMLNVEKCIYIGDTKTDMATAINAGIDGIGVGWALTSKEDLLAAGAKYVASDMKDLLKIVRDNYV